MTEPSQPAHTLLICTVGGTCDPICRSLLYWRPARVVFVASCGTRHLVDEVRDRLRADANWSIGPGQYTVKDVHNAEILPECVNDLRSLRSEVDDWTTRTDGRYRVVVDFTAGTKCMSAALALVARRWPCEYSYVGGRSRTKKGVGVVESGSECVVESVNPWEALGYQAVEDAVAVFNHGGYAASAVILQRAIEQVGKPEIKRQLATLQALVDAYAAWDRFDHGKASKRFADAIKNGSDLDAFFTDAANLRRRLDRHKTLVSQIDGSRASMPAIRDLVQNAERRAAEGRYDDAVARLYRAVEALAQCRLRDAHRIPDTGAVPLRDLPEKLRHEWAGRAREGRVSLALRDVYTLLDALGDDLAARFKEAGLDDERSPLVTRNSSILAHGFEAVTEDGYTALRDAVRDLLDIEQADDWRLPAVR